MRVFSLFLALVVGVYADSGLYPPGLVPLINRANALLSAGQFNDAAKVYTEAIEQSPSDYLLYYKRATAYLSLNRHAAALDDFDRVLSLTSNTFDNAHLMKAKILTRDGQFSLAQQSLTTYRKAKANDPVAVELEAQITEGDQLAAKANKERAAHLWNACIESSSSALRVASHSVQIRQLRAECALAAGDVESSVGDLTRLTHLMPPSSQLQTLISRLSYFVLPPSPASYNALRQCLHYDPDSKPCLTLHRITKSFERSFATLSELEDRSDWRGVVNLLLGGKGKEKEVWKRWEEAIDTQLARENLHPLTGPSAEGQSLPLPDLKNLSSRRQTLIRALCKAYTGLEVAKESGHWCEMLLKLHGCEEDVDGLIGRGDALMAKAKADGEGWEEAIRVYEQAFEASGRSNRDVHQRLQKAQRLLKQSKQKDYYKILGVPRDADTRAIKKAFRKAAKTAHPDKGGSEAKMAAVNEAYEVLSKPELRQRFDNGDDPNDPSGGAGSYGNPFAGGPGGGHPFAQFFQQGGAPGGGGFQFHFSHGG